MMELVRAGHPSGRYTEPRGPETCFSGLFQNQQEGQYGWPGAGVGRGQWKMKSGPLRTLCATLRTLAFILRREAIEGFLSNIFKRSLTTCLIVDL